MKKALLVFAVMGAFALASCSSSYDGKTASELCMKCSNDSYSESDVNNLLKQYEACWKEINRFAKKKAEGSLSDEENSKMNEYCYALNEMEYVLAFKVAREYPDVENKVRDITRKYKVD
ncbi:MAG: YgdI/YgdR family lipoprotein [Muribaculaceae bacterium]|nr:YgdI/YgdR family lipoprotein [Muribaculaceae bacterium]